MFHKIKNVAAIPDDRLSVQFCEGVTKIYDVKPLFEQIPVFIALKNEEEFFDVTVDVGGYGIIWNDDLDLSCDELWENGIQAETPQGKKAQDCLVSSESIGCFFAVP